MDFCDLKWRLRSWFFAADRDITLQSDRKLILGDGTEVPSCALVPVGGIILWSGSVGSIPSNWQICDGTNGTPDLRDRFVVGAGSSYAVGATGGSATVNLRHDHDVDSGATASDSHSHGSGTLATDSDSHSHGSGTLATDSDSHDHTWSDTSSGPSATEQVADDNHSHQVDSGLTASASGHQHGPGTLSTDTGSAQVTVASSAHTHDVSGTTASDNHSHSVTSGTTDSDNHSHSVTSGTTASDSHSHGSGTLNTDNALSTTEENRPPYYALAYIQRMA